MNEKGQLMVMTKLQDAIGSFLALFLFIMVTTPITAILSDGKIGLNNASIYPMGGITLLILQMFALFMAIAFLIRILSNNPQQPTQPPYYG